METSKQCFKCNQTLPLSEFYKHPQMADGHLNKCKTCNKRDTMERYNALIVTPEFVKSERKRGRNKYHRLYKDTYAPTKKEYRQRWMERYPEKVRAHSLSGKAKPTISGNHMHHWSYAIKHAKDVIELSPKDHAKAHRFLLYDQERMMYRTTSGVLLDTRQRHEAYIFDKISNEED